MGNQTTTSNEKKREPKEIIINTSKSNIQSSGYLSNFSYKGVKTDAGSSQNSQDIKESMTETSTAAEKQADIKEAKVPTTFVWKEGGRSLYITGSFSNWTQWFVMTKINNNFELTLVNIDINCRNYQEEFININS